EDATLALLDALGLGADYMAREGRGCVTVDCYVRYQRELRAGDILHVESGVLSADAEGLRFGHKLFDSATRGRCTRVEQEVRHVRLDGRQGVPLSAAQQGAVEARRVAWDGPARERRLQPRGTEGFVDSARDTVKPWELDVYGQSAFPYYVHRFS